VSFTPYAADLNVSEHNESKKSRHGNWEQTSVSRWKDSPDPLPDTKRTNGEGKPCRSRAQETEDADSDDRREQSIGRDCAGLGRIIKGSQVEKDGGCTLSESVSGWCETEGTTAVAFWVSKFVPALTSRGWNTVNNPLPKNWSDGENSYTELQATLGKEGIRLIRMRQGVSSGSDEQVGSSSQIP
jgi:hypothetical protein